MIIKYIKYLLTHTLSSLPLQHAFHYFYFYVLKMYTDLFLSLEGGEAYQPLVAVLLYAFILCKSHVDVNYELTLPTY